MLEDNQCLTIVIIFCRRNDVSQTDILWGHNLFYQHTYWSGPLVLEAT